MNKIDNASRVYELDGLRVMAFLLLIAYHIGMLYVQGWDWHYKSAYQSEILANVMLWSNQWRMLLLFFISGAALSLLIRARGTQSLLLQKSLRLLLPLVFGVCVTVVPQVYVEMDYKYSLQGFNYGQFWWAYLDQNSDLFDGIYTVGKLHLTWNHLWYLLYLWCYVLLFVLSWPLLEYLAALYQRSMRGHFNSPCVRRAVMLLVPIGLFYGVDYFLYARFPHTHNFVWDWHSHGMYILAFSLGVGLVRRRALWRDIRDMTKALLPMAILSYIAIVWLFNGHSLPDGEVWGHLTGLIWAANKWLWLLVILGLGQRLFFRSSQVVHALNSRVFCFYILHQTLIIWIAYWIVPMDLHWASEVAIVVLATLGGCLIGYEVAYRVPLLRTAMGIRGPTTDRQHGAGLGVAGESHAKLTP